MLLLDCEPEVSLERVRKRGDVPDEFERLDALQKVRDIFLGIRRDYIRVVDASAAAQDVAVVCEGYLSEVVSRVRGAGK